MYYILENNMVICSSDEPFDNCKEIENITTDFHFNNQKYFSVKKNTLYFNEEKYKKDKLKKNLIQELKELDTKAIRSIRAILCNKGTEDDIEFLNNLEDIASQKRSELNNL